MRKPRRLATFVGAKIRDITFSCIRRRFHDRVRAERRWFWYFIHGSAGQTNLIVVCVHDFCWKLLLTRLRKRAFAIGLCALGGLTRTLVSSECRTVRSSD